MKNKLLLLLVCTFHVVWSIAQSDDTGLDTAKPTKKSTIFQHLKTDAPTPTMIITTDIKQILDQKYSIDPTAATLEYIVDGQSESWDIELKARGKSRRKICYMPPLKVSFSKDQLKDRGIRKKFNSLKIVSYCKNQNAYENYVLREYLAYELYNVVTDYSFKAQLVKIEYRDAKGKVEPVIRYGFIIENTDELANRLKAKEKNKFEFRRDSLDHYQHDVFIFFQYMIGNTDWKIGALHNTKMIREKATKDYFVIPYDFDYSGFVNTVYSIPNVDLRQTHVKERIYMGSCKNPEELESVRQHFISKKEELFAVVNDFDKLNKRSKKNLRCYLKSFYKTLESKKRFKKSCLKPGKIWE